MAVTKRAIEDEAEWLEWRKQGVGAAEVGALFDCHDFLTKYQLYHQKRSGSKSETTKAMQDGRDMQEVALKKLQREYPELSPYDPKMHYLDSEIGAAATPDAFGEDARGLGVIEIKWVRPWVFRQHWWSIEGELVPPLWIQLQVIQQAWLCGAKWGKACALVHDDDGLNLYLAEVEIRQDVIENIKMEIREFWRRVADGDEPRPDYERDGEAIRNVTKYEDGSEIDLSGNNELPDLLKERAGAIAAVSFNEKKRKDIDSQLFHMLGKHMSGKYSGGYIIAKTIHRTAYVAKATDYRQIRVVEK